MEAMVVVAILLASSVAVALAGPSVIVVGAGFSGISAAKTLSDAGIEDILILEATDRVGGRVRKATFAGVNVEMGANWVEGVNGRRMNPVWKMANKLHLRSFYSDYSNLSSNTYKEGGGLYRSSEVRKAFDLYKEIEKASEKFSRTLPSSGRSDVSVLTFQRIMNHVPSTPLDMVVDYLVFDYEFGEPPRTTSLKNSVLLPTFTNFGDDVYFVADQRGYESIVCVVASQFLRTNKSGSLVDPRLMPNKPQWRGAMKLDASVVRHIHYSQSGVAVLTEDGSVYKADYVMVSVSLGVLQTNLIQFKPDLPHTKTMALYKFDMVLFTKIFLKFPYKFWPDGNGTEFFLYANERRGYYPTWQHLEKQYPGANMLMVIVTDEESRRIEQQPDSHTKAEAMEVLRNLFGKYIPEATDIFVARWWSNRFYRGSFSNWPIGVNQYEYNQIKAPVGRVYFTGEHTSEQYNGYVHGAYLAGIDSANMMIKCIKTRICEVEIKPKDS